MSTYTHLPVSGSYILGAHTWRRGLRLHGTAAGGELSGVSTVADASCSVVTSSRGTTDECPDVLERSDNSHAGCAAGIAEVACVDNSSVGGRLGCTSADCPVAGEAWEADDVCGNRVGTDREVGSAREISSEGSLNLRKNWRLRQVTRPEPSTFMR